MKTVRKERSPKNEMRVTMVIVLASFIVLGSVIMFVFSPYTKSDKRKLLMQNASSMASITSVVDITNNGAPELLKVFVLSLIHI